MLHYRLLKRLTILHRYVYKPDLRPSEQNKNSLSLFTHIFFLCVAPYLYQYERELYLYVLHPNNCSCRLISCNSYLCCAFGNYIYDRYKFICSRNRYFQHLMYMINIKISFEGMYFSYTYEVGTLHAKIKVSIKFSEIFY